jgi:hypothetical protein
MMRSSRVMSSARHEAFRSPASARQALLGRATARRARSSEVALEPRASCAQDQVAHDASPPRPSAAPHQEAGTGRSTGREASHPLDIQSMRASMPRHELADLGLIGNCQSAALVARDGAIVWSCLPRFDSPPSSRAARRRAGRHLPIGAADGRPGTQRYLQNTNVLETRFDSPTARFACSTSHAALPPARAQLSGRRSSCASWSRCAGTPRIRGHCDPMLGWSKARPRREQGSHHVSFHGYDSRAAPHHRRAALVPRRRSLRAHRAQALRARLGRARRGAARAALRALPRETVRYWQQWVKHCDVPPHYQEEVIRSALALKLHCFEDTGAIVAALTTSFARGPGRGPHLGLPLLLAARRLLRPRRLPPARPLRGARAVPQLPAQRRLVLAGPRPRAALPHRRQERPRREHARATGLATSATGPVRVGNGAALHRQHDVFGEMVLALTPLFLDARFREHATPPGARPRGAPRRKAVAVAGQPDAGIWECAPSGARRPSARSCAGPPPSA